MSNLSELEKYLFDDKEAYFYCKGIKCRRSIHGKSYFRFNKAKEQADKNTVDIEIISMYINEFLEKIGIRKVKEPKFDLSKYKIDYDIIKQENSLKDRRDIVWLKFTEDGYLGVVASSHDINFKIPCKKSQYDIKNGEEWAYNTSGIIVHKLEKKWDESFTLLFPLNGIPEGYNRGHIEKAIGNLLIQKGVPILDLYSHLYQGKE